MRYRKLLKKWEKSHVVTTHFQLLLQNQWVAPFLRVNIRSSQPEQVACSCSKGCGAIVSLQAQDADPPRESITTCSRVHWTRCEGVDTGAPRPSLRAIPDGGIQDEQSRAGGLEVGAATNRERPLSSPKLPMSKVRAEPAKFEA